MTDDLYAQLERLQARWLADRARRLSLQAARNAQAQTVAWARLAMSRVNENTERKW